MTALQPSPTPRVAAHAIDRIHLDRWSPRAFDASPVTEDQLFPLFEAARWAPSAFNAQPWRFVYALRDTPEWDGLFAALLPMNQGWVRQASALMFLLSDTLVTPPGGSEPVTSATASFDAGAAWGALAQEATRLGLHTHAMAGFDRALAAEAIGSSDRFRVEAAIAVGRVGDPATLPDLLRAREFPSPRRPIAEFAFRGRMPRE